MNRIQQLGIEVEVAQRRLEYHRQNGLHFPVMCRGCSDLREELRKARSRVDAELLADSKTAGASEKWEAPRTREEPKR